MPKRLKAHELNTTVIVVITFVIRNSLWWERDLILLILNLSLIKLKFL